MITIARFLALAAILCAAPLCATSRAVLCPTDCNGDGIVSSAEIVRSARVAGGTDPYRLCPPSDRNADGEITGGELRQGVAALFAGCPDPTVYRAPALTERTGPLDDGRGVLPNGRRLDPAGMQIPAQTLPLNLTLTPDERLLLVTNDGIGDNDDRQLFQVVDTETFEVRLVEVPHFFGLALTPSGDRAFLGSHKGGGPDLVEALYRDDGAFIREDEPVAELPANSFPSGIALSPDGSHLYVLGLLSNAFHSIDLGTGAVTEAKVPIGNIPYSIIVSADGTRAYVSSWGLNNGNPDDTEPTGLVPPPLPPVDPNGPTRSSVAVVDLTDPDGPALVRYVPIARSLAVDNEFILGGSHPSAMALSPDEQLLYVTASNLDVLSVIDTVTLETVADVPLNVFEEGPLRTRIQGLYPNALALTKDGHRIYVADAGINAVQVLGVDPETRTFTPLGFIPTGFYPSALALSADDTRLYVANGKGNGVGPNGGEEFESQGLDTTYIARLLKGSLSVIDDVDQYDLQSGTDAVVAANGFAPVQLRWVDGPAGEGEVQRRHPVPIDFGSGPSDQIKYVVFILKENRTYDQILGSLPGGNGDPELNFFGPDVTPNQQALATEFAAGDNFYADGEVSTPGHEWIDQATSTDFTEKLWPANYDRFFPSSTLEQGQEGFAKAGFIFQAMERNGVSHRVYGETLGLLSRIAAGINGGGVSSVLFPLLQAFGGLPQVSQIYTLVNGELDVLRMAGVDVDLLQSTIWPNQMLEFPSNILAHRTDVERAALFRSELDQFAAAGELPSYIHIWLPNDHTFGASPGNPTPRSAVADNDAGLGLIVDALSHSPFWPHMVIFVTEDDPQDGQDHVSAYRTLGLVISPYVKRGYISHVHHSGVSMTKTINLLLGLPPMTQFDRYATDMRDYFTATPDLTPYEARPRLEPAALSPTVAEAPNELLRRAAELSASLNLEMFDMAGENMSRVLQLVHAGERLQQEGGR